MGCAHSGKGSPKLTAHPGPPSPNQHNNSSPQTQGHLCSVLFPVFKARPNMASSSPQVIPMLLDVENNFVST
ncbi:hypothetical protein CYB_2742 [Synechococcus sp. JA-2-3B'a(2-13)]|nr:hypothetical protein CYB_2742 [Synechococcus sp. JA-2-3B'a(2-13)]